MEIAVTDRAVSYMRALSRGRMMQRHSREGDMSEGKKRCAVLVVLALVGFSMLSGCGSGGGSASNDSALAAKVRTAIASTDYAGQVHDVTAQSDGTVSVTLDSTGSSDFGDKVMPDIVANAVLGEVPEVKQLTLLWSTGAQIGVYTPK
jgi:hypothetical protein